ncbi:general stress protein [Gulosibacter chungangensis]|uniref:General stress protein 17M-like domain-containing protein n=1 Tax=Gulosibacter chungangensis TaxID=979746 RepID=A0A7J5BBC9_9MICO|nr:general stress protein [Gulosibacter chungangensis]KAB1643450.1 hypothetical protein F8O05_06060 [Gulosibacter chungangensis]
MSSPRNLGQTSLPTIPTGDVVASYPTYDAARHAVDVLVREEGLPVSSISVVGNDLKSVERITGRMNYTRAALNGLGNGVMIAIFMSLMWLIFFPTTDMLAIVGVFVISIAFGVIWGILAYALSPQKREFTSIMQVTASRFDLVVPHNMSAKVRDTLQRGGSWSQPMDAQPGQQPGQYTQPGQPTQPPQPTQFGQPAQPGHPTQPMQPAQPAQPPRTYGEMQDELRRREREQQSSTGGSTEV